MPCRRLLKRDAATGDPATIEDAAHSWILLDIDKLPIEGDLFAPVAEPERAAAYIRARLPSEFDKAQCLWRLTSSAGVKKDPMISMRLGFWLDRALTGAETKTWLTGTIADCAIYTPNQVIYAAAPVFMKGRTDPVGRRSGILEGEISSVTPREPNLRIGQESKLTRSRVDLAPRKAPEGVIFDTETAVERGRELIERTLTSDEWEGSLRDLPSPTGARAYKLAASLKDEALSPEKIVDLLIDMVPWFVEIHWPQIKAMVDSVFQHGQNEPGCGNSNSIAHLFTEIVNEWEAETRDRQVLWEKIAEISHGAIQPLPENSAPPQFSLALTEAVRRIIAADRAELARRLG